MGHGNGRPGEGGRSAGGNANAPRVGKVNRGIGSAPTIHWEGEDTAATASERRSDIERGQPRAHVVFRAPRTFAREEIDAHLG